MVRVKTNAYGGDICCFSGKFLHLAPHIIKFFNGAVLEETDGRLKISKFESYRTFIERK